MDGDRFYQRTYAGEAIRPTSALSDLLLTFSMFVACLAVAFGIILASLVIAFGSISISGPKTRLAMGFEPETSLAGSKPKALAMGSAGDSMPVLSVADLQPTPVASQAEPEPALTGGATAEPSPATTAPEGAGSSAGQGTQITQPAEPEAQSTGGRGIVLNTAGDDQKAKPAHGSEKNKDKPGRQSGQHHGKKNK